MQSPGKEADGREGRGRKRGGAKTRHKSPRWQLLPKGEELLPARPPHRTSLTLCTAAGPLEQSIRGQRGSNVSPAPSHGPSSPTRSAVLTSRWASWALQTSSGRPRGMRCARHVTPPPPGVLGGVRAWGLPVSHPVVTQRSLQMPAPTRRRADRTAYIRWSWPRCAGAGGGKSWDPFQEQVAKSLRHTKAQRNVRDPGECHVGRSDR